MLVEAIFHAVADVGSIPTRSTRKPENSFRGGGQEIHPSPFCGACESGLPGGPVLVSTGYSERAGGNEQATTLTAQTIKAKNKVVEMPRRQAFAPLALAA